MAVATFDPQYRAATEALALLDRSERGKLAVSGPQAAEFLDSLLSNDVAGLQPGTGVDATLLTHKGRMLAEVRVLRTEDELVLDTERVALQALFDALHQFRVGYDAQLHKRTLAVGLLSQNTSMPTSLRTRRIGWPASVAARWSCSAAPGGDASAASAPGPISESRPTARVRLCNSAPYPTRN